MNEKELQTVVTELEEKSKLLKEVLAELEMKSKYLHTEMSKELGNKFTILQKEVLKKLGEKPQDIQKEVLTELKQKCAELQTSILTKAEKGSRELKTAVLTKLEEIPNKTQILTELEEKRTQLCNEKFCTIFRGTFFILLFALGQFLLIHYCWPDNNNIPMSILIVVFVLFVFIVQCVILTNAIRTTKKQTSIINIIELMICKGKIGGGISKDEIEREMRFIKKINEYNSSPLVISFFK